MEKSIYSKFIIFVFGILALNYVLSPRVLAQSVLAGDVNRDGRVDIVDIGQVIDVYGILPVTNNNADLNNDDKVDIIDIGIVIDNYGRTGSTQTPTPAPTVRPSVPPGSTPPPVGNISYFVDKNNVGGRSCSDTGSGDSNQPFCTIAKALSVVQPGQVIGVRGGSYPAFEVTKSGTSGSYLTIAGYNNERPHVTGTGGIKISAKSYVRIVGFEVSGAGGGYGGGGIYIMQGGMHNIIESNIVHDNLAGYTSGINIGNNSSHNIVLNNTVYNNGLKGIRVAGNGTGNQIIGNHSYGNRGDGGGSDGITATEGTTNTLVKNNIVHDNSDDGIDFWSSHGNTMIGNISYNNLGPGDGNGFKLGGTDTGGQHLIIGNVAYGNKRDGFDSNHSYGNTYYNNTAVGNGGVGFRDVDKFATCRYSNCRTIFINNIGYNNNKNFAASPHTGTSHNNLWFSDSGGAAVTYQGSATFAGLDQFYAASGNRLDNPNAGTLSTLSVNPLFVNVGAKDFHLTANSPAINKGDPSNPGSIQANGTPDIGAFER